MQKPGTEDRELALRRTWHPLSLDNVKKLGANKTICIFKLIFASGRLDEKNQCAILEGLVISSQDMTGIRERGQEF